MDGFTGFKTAAVEELNDGVTVVMDPFYADVLVMPWWRWQGLTPAVLDGPRSA